MNRSIHQCIKKISTPAQAITWILLSFSFVSFQPATEYRGTIIPVIRKQLVVDGAYQDIRIDGNINIVLTNEPANTFIIEGRERDVRKVHHHLKDGKLMVNVLRQNFFSAMTIYISAINVRSIAINGDAVINSVDVINVNDLRFSLNGHASMKLKTRGKINVESPYEYDLFRRAIPLDN